MDLSSSVDERLWLSVRAAYESGNYSGAVLEATYYLSDLIRNKSGLDTDGAQLINDTFAGASPIVRINSLHTQSDRDEQKGVHLLLLGFYTAIRNPRSHEKREDSAETADALICFVNYLAGLIDKARSPFDAEQIIGKVKDPLFGPSSRYADLIVAKIPKRKLQDIAIEVFRSRANVPEKNLTLFFESAIKTLSSEEQTTLWEVASEELESATEESEFISIIRIVKAHWGKITDLARLRTEHLLISSVREGLCASSGYNSKCVGGEFGTWASEISMQMILKNEYATAVINKILSSKQGARAYALQYHIDALRKVSPEPDIRVVKRLNELLAERDGAAFAALWFVGFVDSTDDKWVSALKDNYQGYVSSLEINDEDIPF